MVKVHQWWHGDGPLESYVIWARCPKKLRQLIRLQKRPSLCHHCCTSTFYCPVTDDVTQSVTDYWKHIIRKTVAPATAHRNSNKIWGLNGWHNISPWLKYKNCIHTLWCLDVFHRFYGFTSDFWVFTSKAYCCCITLTDKVQGIIQPAIGSTAKNVQNMMVISK